MCMCTFNMFDRREFALVVHTNLCNLCETREITEFLYYTNI